MSDIMAQTHTLPVQAKEPPLKLGWQQPIISRSEGAKGPSLKPEDVMIDALVLPRREVVPTFTTPLFAHKGKS